MCIYDRIKVDHADDVGSEQDTSRRLKCACLAQCLAVYCWRIKGCKGRGPYAILVNVGVLETKVM